MRGGFEILGAESGYFYESWWARLGREAHISRGILRND
jgi:hypothetical protein